MKPSVSQSPRQEYAAWLEKEWFKVIKWASIGFLAALKHYHKSGAQDLRLRLTWLENSITSNTQEKNTAVGAKKNENERDQNLKQSFAAH